MNEEWVIDQTEESEEQEQDNLVYDISSYPADITLKGYLDKWEQGQIEIPEFQRAYVWDQVKASKLIESFLLGLPVPSVFLYKYRKTNKLAVIDGQQRILSSINYFKNKFGDKGFGLKKVLPKWKGKTYEELDDNDRFQLDDAVLRATVVQQLDPDDNSSIYYLFERLNTGGVNLNPMEIRKCVYSGDFFTLLEELNQNEQWRKIIAQPKPDKRLRDVEFILRCLALYDGWKDYNSPMKRFLNDFMTKVKKMNKGDRLKKFEEMRDVFNKTCDIIERQLPEKPFHLRGKINYAAMDSIFNAAAQIGDNGRLGDNYQDLTKDQEFLDKATKSTSEKKTLHTRFERAVDILSA